MLSSVNTCSGTRRTGRFKSKFNRVNLVAPASPNGCLLLFPNDRAIQYKLGPEMLTRVGNSNVVRLPVIDI